MHRAQHALTWPLTIRRLIPLVALFMLPVPMHAGAEPPHHDALFALILDARDGTIDHQMGDGQPSGAGASHGVAGHEHQGETPAFGNGVHAQSPLAGVTALVLIACRLLSLPARPPLQCWPGPGLRRGTMPALETPPPRFAA